MTSQATVETRYTLQSNGIIHTPGILAWAINGYKFDRDKDVLKRVFTEGYNLPDDVAHKLLNGDIVYAVEGSTVVFHA